MRSNLPRKGSSNSVPSSTSRVPCLPQYRVMLLRTSDHALLFIVKTVMELLRFGRAEADYRMWLAYHTGRSLLVTTHLERAELLAEQFRARGLTIVLELG